MRLIGVKLTLVNIRLVVAAGLATVPTLVVAPAAYGSCGGPAARSPHAFVGTVVDTSEEDRIATVITDRGRRVTVLGTEDTSRFSESFSSVDRRYALGGRYEFHPTNAASPYRDNACTATRRLAGPGLQPVERSEEFLPDWLAVDEQAGPVGYVMFFGPAVLGVLVVALLARRAWRRLCQTPG